eukprot:1143739-Pelagomonas_calceolata.AAC.2
MAVVTSCTVGQRAGAEVQHDVQEREEPGQKLCPGIRGEWAQSLCTEENCQPKTMTSRSNEWDSLWPGGRDMPDQFPCHMRLFLSAGRQSKRGVMTWSSSTGVARSGRAQAAWADQERRGGNRSNGSLMLARVCMGRRWGGCTAAMDAGDCGGWRRGMWRLEVVLVSGAVGVCGSICARHSTHCAARRPALWHTQGSSCFGGG